VQTTANLAITTSREDFRALAAEHRVVPVTRKVLADSETPLSAYRKLAANRPGTFLLESAENGRSWSRWSFIGAGAPSALTVRDGDAVWLGVTPKDAPRGGDPLQALRATLELLKTEPLSGLPPLSSGLVGFFAYDMVRRLERLPSLAVDDLGLPDTLLLLATDIAAVDHHEGTITLIANAVNWNGTDERVDWAYDDAVARLDVMTAALGEHLPSTVATFSRPEPLAPLAAHAGGVRRDRREARRRHRGGEAFQVVPSQRFEMDTDADPLDVYRMLRVSNPSPYMYLLNVPNELADWTFRSSAPARGAGDGQGRPGDDAPDRGTRWRGQTEEEDLLLEKELQEDEKERAEHLMLVDLGRNDLAGSAAGHRARGGLQPHRALQPRHALVSTVTGCSRPVKTRWTRSPPASLRARFRVRRRCGRWNSSRRSRRPAAAFTAACWGTWTSQGNADFAIADPHRADAQRHAYVQAGGGVVADSERAIRVHRGGEQGQGGPQRDRGGGNADRAVIRLAQLLLLLSAGALWGASLWCGSRWLRSTGSGSRRPRIERHIVVDGAGAAGGAAAGRRGGGAGGAGLAAAVARGARRRGSAGMAYLAISLWVIRDVAVRAAHLADVPVADLVGTQRTTGRDRHVGGRGGHARRCGAARALSGQSQAGGGPLCTRVGAAPRAGRSASERAIWDALDEGRDPTDPDNKGR
jgi:anthranilate synthase component 1